MITAIISSFRNPESQRVDLWVPEPRCLTAPLGVVADPVSPLRKGGVWGVSCPLTQRGAWCEEADEGSLAFFEASHQNNLKFRDQRIETLSANPERKVGRGVPRSSLLSRDRQSRLKAAGVTPSSILQGPLPAAATWSWATLLPTAGLCSRGWDAVSCAQCTGWAAEPSVRPSCSPLRSPGSPRRLAPSPGESGCLPPSAAAHRGGNVLSAPARVAAAPPCVAAEPLTFGHHHRELDSSIECSCLQHIQLPRIAAVNSTALTQWSRPVGCAQVCTSPRSAYGSRAA